MPYEKSLEEMNKMYLEVFKEKGGSFEPNNFMVKHVQERTMPLEDIVSYLVSTHEDWDGDNYSYNLSKPDPLHSRYAEIRYHIPGLGGPEEPLIRFIYRDHEKAYKVLGFPLLYSPYANADYAFELGLFLYFYNIKVTIK